MLMMSLETIADLARLSALEAAEAELEPYQPADADECLHWGEHRTRNVFPFPSLGDYRPWGWRLIEYVTCDKTGLGYESEPALTIRGVKAWCHERRLEDETAGFAIIEEGEFQVVLGYFTQDDEIHPEVEPDDSSEWEIAGNCELCGLPYQEKDAYCLSLNCGAKIDPKYHEGDQVRVGDPGKWDHWPEAFTGTVMQRTGSEEYDVEDEDGKEWSVSEYHMKPLAEWEEEEAEKSLFSDGLEVNVGDPGYGDLWQHAFTGHIMYKLHGTTWLVVDQDDNRFNVLEEQMEPAE